jgi:hypothetical protein
MRVALSPGFPVAFRHLLLAGGGIAILAAAIWILSAYGRWKIPGGPFVEFEIRLPAGILLPNDRNIEVTFWSGGLGRGCRRIEIRRSIEQPEIAGRCSIIGDSTNSALSVRLSRFAEGYWKMPIGSSKDRDPGFGPWQRIEFTWAPVGEREVSSLPHGDYYFRYLVRP